MLSINNFFGQNITGEKIYFDCGNYNLSDSSIKKLKLVLAKIIELNSTEMKLTGHTESDGNNSYNEDLSKKRVSALPTYIISKHLNNDLAQLNCKGEVNPVTTNDNDNGKKMNRHVELLVKYI